MHKNSKNEKNTHYTNWFAYMRRRIFTGLEKFSKDGKWGFRNAAGKVVVSAKYDEVGDFSEGLAPVCIIKNRGPRWGYINNEGKEVIPTKYNPALSFSEGYARYGDDYIDKTGSFIFKSALYPYLKQADRLLKKVDYGKTNDKKSIKAAKSEGSFIVKGSYLIVSREATVEILKYTDNYRDPQMMNRVKTLIFKQDTYFSRNYKKVGSYASSITIKSYGTTLLYFDMENKQYLGRDYIAPVWIPNSFNSDQSLGIHSNGFPLDEAVRKVESRMGHLLLAQICEVFEVVIYFTFVAYSRRKFRERQRLILSEI